VLVNRYRLDHELCSTPVTQVWRGTDMLLNRVVGVRILRGVTDDTPVRFLAKARLTGAVSHQGITRVYDFVDSRAGLPPFLVTEYVDGATMAQIIANGPMELATVLDVVAQAAGALHAAHQAGLRHGAIKPANILMTQDGVIKLTDFGGTPSSPYRAPELASGSPATVPGDVYSLGVIARECLAGTRYKAREAATFFGSLADLDPRRRGDDAGTVAAQATQLLRQLRPLPGPASVSQHHWRIPRPRPRPHGQRTGSSVAALISERDLALAESDRPCRLDNRVPGAEDAANRHHVSALPRWRPLPAAAVRTRTPNYKVTHTPR